MQEGKREQEGEGRRGMREGEGGRGREREEGGGGRREGRGREGGKEGGREGGKEGGAHMLGLILVDGPHHLDVTWREKKPAQNGELPMKNDLNNAHKPPSPDRPRPLPSSSVTKARYETMIAHRPGGVTCTQTCLCTYRYRVLTVHVKSTATTQYSDTSQPPHSGPTRPRTSWRPVRK